MHKKKTIIEFSFAFNFVPAFILVKISTHRYKSKTRSRKNEHLPPAT